MSDFEILILGLLPPLLEMFFPVLRPRAAKEIDETRISGYELCRASVLSVDDGALHTALHKHVSSVGIQARRLVQLRHHMQRLLERHRIVEGLLDEQTIAVWPEHFNHFEFTTELEHGV